MTLARPVRRGRRGAILIIAMLTLAVVAVIAAALARSIRTEALATANQAAGVQADELARAGENYLVNMLIQNKADLTTYDSSNFANIQVGDGYIFFVRPNYNDPDDNSLPLPVFGLSDESAKLNINTADSDSLARLCNMTTEMSDSIIDWRDTDSTEQPNGAEDSYYQGLSPPYLPKNAPFETPEELLMVKGWTRRNLYGYDLDSVSDPQSQANNQGQISSGLNFNSTSQFSQFYDEYGLSDLLTCFSSDANTAADGTARININDQNARQQLRQLLSDTFGAARGAEIGGALGRSQLIDLFDFYFQSKMTSDEFMQIEDYITTSAEKSVKGLININTAPRAVLLTLGLDDSDVDTLLTNRPQQGDPNGAASIAWVADALGQKAVGIGSKITGHGTQFSTDILAISGNGKAFRRVRIVVDTSTTTPQVLYRRDITSRGWPTNVDPQILADLRSGNASQATSSGGFTR